MHLSSQFSIGNLKKTLLKDDNKEIKYTFDSILKINTNLMSLLIENILLISELKMSINNYQKFKNINVIQPFYVKIQIIQFSISLNLLSIDQIQMLKQIYMIHQLTVVWQQYKPKSEEFINNLISKNKRVKKYINTKQSDNRYVK
ncbi:unnamed protein product [Paramecium primaurelia]|uniref:Uncharacterized protein n=1 Tax=Paramecium primaurelia TaxID=5886 RepID=A0A8S1PQP2_PARPR|nr:unnamed protein product [Paramecium primaurelia]